MAEVFIAPKGTLAPADKRALRKAGIVVVEANPDEVKFIRSTEEVSGSDMLWAALDALGRVTGEYEKGAKAQREALAHNLLKIVVERRSATHKEQEA